MSKYPYKILSGSRKARYFPWYVEVVGFIFVVIIWYFLLKGVIPNIPSETLKVIGIGLIALFVLSIPLNFLVKRTFNSPEVPEGILQKKEKVLFILINTKIRRLLRWFVTRIIVTNRRFIIAGRLGPFATFLIKESLPLDDVEVEADDDNNLRFKNRYLVIYTDHGGEILKAIKTSKGARS
ncbi:hypothetical protein JW710_03750 [Candidatus Dojkabacteria bacterium]|nr:hypothetical protein [Candidatus Dojkabacteria bacterium]